MKLKIVLTLLLSFLLFSCQKDPGKFTISYSMESSNNFKELIEIDEGGSYRIEIAQLLFDRMAGTYSPEIREGVVPANLYKKIKEIVGKQALYRSKSSYGYEVDNGEFVLYQYIVKSELGEVMVSVKGLSGVEVPKELLELTEYMHEVEKVSREKK